MIKWSLLTHVVGHGCGLDHVLIKMLDKKPQCGVCFHTDNRHVSSSTSCCHIDSSYIIRCNGGLQQWTSSQGQVASAAVGSLAHLKFKHSRYRTLSSVVKWWLEVCI